MDITIRMISGTNYGGQWDGWYGPSGRPDNETMPYDIAKVINSHAGKAASSVGHSLYPEKVRKTCKHTQIT